MSQYFERTFQTKWYVGSGVDSLHEDYLFEEGVSSFRYGPGVNVEPRFREELFGLFDLIYMNSVFRRWQVLYRQEGILEAGPYEFPRCLEILSLFSTEHPEVEFHVTSSFLSGFAVICNGSGFHKSVRKRREVSVIGEIREGKYFHTKFDVTTEEESTPVDVMIASLIPSFLLESFSWVMKGGSSALDYLTLSMLSKWKTFQNVPEEEIFAVVEGVLDHYVTHYSFFSVSYRITGTDEEVTEEQMESWREKEESIVTRSGDCLKDPEGETHKFYRVSEFFINFLKSRGAIC